MKRLFLFLALALFAVSCSKENKELPLPEASIVLADGSAVTGDVPLASGEPVAFSAKCDNVIPAAYQWRLDGALKSTDKTYEFSSDSPGDYMVSLTVLNADKIPGKEVSVKVTVSGPYKTGTFILTEGNMGSGNGIVAFVDGKGTYFADPYGLANPDDKGKPTSPGSLLQDMFVYKGNAYFIAQNGAQNGQGARLVIADAQTLKMKKQVTGSIDNPDLWPQHIVVVDENKAYIRYSTSDYETRSGIRVMNLSTGVWSDTDIEGTAGAFSVEGSTKARMLLLGDKVFAPCGRYLRVIDTKTDKVVASIEFAATRQTKDIVKGRDGKVYLAVSGTWEGDTYSPVYTSPATIACIDPKDYSYTEKTLPEEFQMPVATWSPNVGMCASFDQDALFFRMGTGFSTSQVARYDYKTGAVTKLLDVSAESGLSPMAYGYLGVDKNGVLYVGTTDYSSTVVGTFDARTGARLDKTYEIKSGSPAAIDFTYRFTD